MIELHPEFGRILAAARKVPRGPVLVVGPVDSGKTTLVRALGSALVAGGPLALVNADLGQAWIGPPTTVARATLRRPRRRWLSLAPERLIFVGVTSPAPAPRSAADALALLAGDPALAAGRVLVDTPGLVKGAAAEAYWGRVAARLPVRLVVAIEEGDELAPVLAMLRDAGAGVLRVAPASAARARNRTERTHYREAAWRRYFRRAALRRFDRSRVQVVAGLDIGRLVSLRDRAGRDLALGVVRAVGPMRIAVVTPLAAEAEVASLAVGAMRVDPRTGCEESGVWPL